MRVRTLATLLVLGCTLTGDAFAQDLKEQVDALLQKAAGLEAEGLLTDAEGVLQEALEVAYDEDAQYGRVALPLGRLLYWNGVTAEGLALLYRAMEMAPSAEAALALVDALLAESDAAKARGEPNVAASDVQRAQDVLDGMAQPDQDSLEGRLRRARCLSRTLGEEGAACVLLRGLLEASPDDAALHQEHLTAVEASRDFEGALQWYQVTDMDRALKLWFTGQVFLNRAHFQFNSLGVDAEIVADYQRAEELVRESARLNPEYYAAAVENASYYRAWSGWVHLRSNRLDAAWKSFRDALGRFPDNSSAIEGFSYVGQRLMEAGRLEDARELFREACLWAPEQAAFWNNYGLTARDTGQYEVAYAAYRRAQRLIPDDPRTVNDTALMLQYHLHRDLDVAEMLLQEARQMARDNWRNATDDATRQDQLAVYGDALVNLWRLFADQGRMRESSAMLQELREADPTREELPPEPPTDPKDDGDE